MADTLEGNSNLSSTVYELSQENQKLKERLRVSEMMRAEWFYSSDEVHKLIKAFRDKYNISPCDGVPYKMKSTVIHLTGEVVERK